MAFSPAPGRSPQSSWAGPSCIAATPELDRALGHTVITGLLLCLLGCCLRRPVQAVDLLAAGLAHSGLLAASHARPNIPAANEFFRQAYERGSSWGAMQIATSHMDKAARSLEARQQAYAWWVGAWVGGES